jgi:hypothetical protein
VRRDVWRVGIGRFLLEGALGVVLVQPMDDRTRLLAIAVALATAAGLHLSVTKGLRRAFWAAHVGLAVVAAAAYFGGRLHTLFAASGLGAAIELAHVDLLDRQRTRESASTLRIPASLWVRRLGSAVVALGVGSASVPLAARAAHPSGFAQLLVVLAAISLLAAGFGAGPGRAVTRPVDAVLFLLLATLLAIGLVG